MKLNHEETGDEREYILGTELKVVETVRLVQLDWIVLFRSHTYRVRTNSERISSTEGVGARVRSLSPGCTPRHPLAWKRGAGRCALG